MSLKTTLATTSLTAALLATGCNKESSPAPAPDDGNTNTPTVIQTNSGEMARLYDQLDQLVDQLEAGKKFSQEDKAMTKLVQDAIDQLIAYTQKEKGHAPQEGDEVAARFHSRTDPKVLFEIVLDPVDKTAVIVKATGKDGGGITTEVLGVYQSGVILGHDSAQAICEKAARTIAEGAGVQKEKLDKNASDSLGALADAVMDSKTIGSSLMQQDNIKTLADAAVQATIDRGAGIVGNFIGANEKAGVNILLLTDPDTKSVTLFTGVRETGDNTVDISHAKPVGVHVLGGKTLSDDEKARLYEKAKESVEKWNKLQKEARKPAPDKRHRSAEMAASKISLLLDVPPPPIGSPEWKAARDFAKKTDPKFRV